MPNANPGSIEKYFKEAGTGSFDASGYRVPVSYRLFFC